MARPTQRLRETLVLAVEKALVKHAPGSIDDQVGSELKRALRTLETDGTHIIDRQFRDQNIWVQYQFQSKTLEATYPLEILVAEAKARLRRRSEVLPNALDRRSL